MVKISHTTFYSFHLRLRRIFQPDGWHFHWESLCVREIGWGVEGGWRRGSGKGFFWSFRQKGWQEENETRERCQKQRSDERIEDLLGKIVIKSNAKEFLWGRGGWVFQSWSSPKRQPSIWTPSGGNTCTTAVAQWSTSSWGVKQWAKERRLMASSWRWMEEYFVEQSLAFCPFNIALSEIRGARELHQVRSLHTNHSLFSQEYLQKF